jgi:integrase
MVGTETYDKLVKFVRMTFKEYERNHPQWRNPFIGIDSPKNIRYQVRDALPEEEVIKIFSPGVLRDSMEVAVCSVMFLAGLRRSEIFALRSEDLDWHTPKITVRHAWQNFSLKRRVMGPPKNKKIRFAPFDKTLQDAISKLWEENGQHEYVFSYPDGTTPGPSWIKGRFKKWLKRAGIELRGRQIVPHSSRHSLASMLENRKVPLRPIQELLDHASLKTTKVYLHSTDRTLRDIGKLIDDAIENPAENEKDRYAMLS